jgi:hypothetical protein
VLLILIVFAACGDGRTKNALCAFCDNDAQCGGNPCFEDVSGQRYCGRPCGDCPAGFSCLTVSGTSMLANTCFPDTEFCEPPVEGDGDAGTDPPPVDDGGRSPGIIVAGPVGPTGGSVARLHFGITGDTRPARCGSAYPQAIIDNIFTQLAQKGVDFVVDQGDHIFNCGFGEGSLAGAEGQMARYVAAAKLVGRTVFMTMGNHECTGSGTALCNIFMYGSNPNYTAFMDALRPVADKPYYRFDVTTQTGLAAFIIIADDVWDAAEEAWLEAQLTDADQKAKYVFVSKHHPDRNTDHPEFQQIYNQVRRHHYTLFLTGHSHLYRRQSNDPRALVIGTGGAPLSSGSFWGYGTVTQGADDRITVTIYDQSTGMVRDNFTVTP